MQPKNENNIAALTHLSALGQYLFPFGNYILPLLIWNLKKNESTVIDHNGRQVLNFQFSVLLYTIVLLLIAIPVFLIIVFNNMSINALFNDHEWIIKNFNISGNSTFITIGLIAIVLLITLKIIEFIYIIYGTIKASNGEQFHYPFTIPFLKSI
ncbi:DUF4870 domain-containing protein [Flavobacterium algicola]|uniref:DUF4870 domain-containing protein n=1 Tax=Flavobacterium algicola TaxID=556529 RepID=UPI001EFD5614|nr:DUF4870 domain-containing protein [Flavobacterium algicola]MCG9793072.1 DUF4870 domain-containing protein [Flavobacterium algicola]